MAVIKAGTYKFVDHPNFGSNGGYFPTNGTKKIELIQFESNNTAFNSMGMCVDSGEYHFAYGKSTANTSGTTYTAADITAGKVIPVYNSEMENPWYPYSDNAYQTIVLATDQTVSDELYTWFNASIEKTLKQSVEQHITDAYAAIGNKSGTIPTQKNLANLAESINTISTGVDTSDATATSADILKDKTAYVKGAKVTGAIDTYDGTVEDVPYTDCLTFTGETGEFTLKATNKAWDGTLEWSTDHNTWTTLSGTEVMQSVDKKLYLRGKRNTTFFDRTNWVSVQWALSAKAGCVGNIQTLLDWENPPTSISKNNCYLELFANCTNLTSAPELPAMTLAMNCYQSMFENCTNLINAPEVLPATTLAGACYQTMFLGCISLTSAPKLPATTLDASCYAQMFSGCTSLTTAPELPATTLLSGCYDRMFNGCANLKVNITSGKKIFTCPSTIPSNAVQYMFDNTGGAFTGTPTAGTTYYYTL